MEKVLTLILEVFTYELSASPILEKVLIWASHPVQSPHDPSECICLNVDIAKGLAKRKRVAAALQMPEYSNVKPGRLAKVETIGMLNTNMPPKGDRSEGFYKKIRF